MKSLILASLLAVAPTIAAPTAGGSTFVNNIWVPVSTAAPLVKRATCNADNVLRDLRNPTRSVSASAFCSSFLQPTVTTTARVTSTVVTPTTTVTSTTTTTTSTTSVTSIDPSATAYCPAPGAGGQTCGLSGDSTDDYLTTNYAADPVTCHENCLANPACNSFQIAGSGPNARCLLHTLTYQQGAAAGVFYSPSDYGYTFYDRNCPDFLPAGCAATKKKAKRAYTGATPTYLATVPASRISSACSCFITPSLLSTATATTTISTSTTTVITVTQTSVSTIVTVTTDTTTITSGTTFVTLSATP